VHAQATIDYADVQRERAALIDLAQDGMAVQFGKKLPPVNKVYFQFKLPGQAANIRLSGQVMWQDWKGRAGVQFVDVPKTSRRLPDEFLGTHLPKGSSRDPLYDVTVEAVPSDDGFRFYDQKGRAPTRPKAGEPYPERAVGRTEIEPMVSVSAL
jgi:hypothetical protein